MEVSKGTVIVLYISVSMVVSRQQGDQGRTQEQLTSVSLTLTGIEAPKAGSSRASAEVVIIVLIHRHITFLSALLVNSSCSD